MDGKQDVERLNSNRTREKKKIVFGLRTLALLSPSNSAARRLAQISQSRSFYTMGRYYVFKAF